MFIDEVLLGGSSTCAVLVKEALKGWVEAGRGKLERAGCFKKCIHALNSPDNNKSNDWLWGGAAFKLFDFFSGFLKLQHFGSHH